MPDLQSQRMIAALIGHDADPVRPPLRRTGSVTLVSVLVAALAAGGLALYGMITGTASAEPTDPSVILLDRESGARYVYLESDRRLHPVLNYTSGLLLAAAESPEVKAVTATRLASVPLGATLGIPDAPDTLPPAERLLEDAWTVCTDHTARSTLLVGTVPSGSPITDRALLVADPAGRTFLIRDGRRFQIRATPLVGYTPSPVAAAWIDAVPAGPDLGEIPPIKIADFAVRACVTRPSAEPAVIRLDPVVPSTAAVHVPRGRGAIVSSPGGAVHVVTDDGRGFPLARPELLVKLGYPGVKPVTVPAELVALLPAGPLLDPSRAGRS